MLVSPWKSQVKVYKKCMLQEPSLSSNHSKLIKCGLASRVPLTSSQSDVQQFHPAGKHARPVTQGARSVVEGQRMPDDFVYVKCFPY